METGGEAEEGHLGTDEVTMVRKGCLTGALQTARRQYKPGYWGVKLGSPGMEKWGQTLEYLYGLFLWVVFIKEP